MRVQPRCKVGGSSRILAWIHSDRCPAFDAVRDHGRATCAHGAGEQPQEPGETSFGVVARGEDVERACEQGSLAMRNLVLDAAVTDPTFGEWAGRGDGRRQGRQPIRAVIGHRDAS